MKRISYTQARTIFRQGGEVYTLHEGRVIEILPKEKDKLIGHEFFWACQRLREALQAKRLVYYTDI